MAKEIGNWGKQPPPKPRRTIPRAETAAELIAYRVEPDEKILWTSYGSGVRQDKRIVHGIVLSAFGSLVLAQVLLTLFGNTPLGPPLASLLWGLCALPFYIGYRMRFGPRFEAYAVTDQRVVILQRHAPFRLKTCEILRLRVDEPEGAGKSGNVMFGKQVDYESHSPNNTWAAWRQLTPEPGFYGIADPLEVARLISQHVAPDVFPDRYARTFDELPAIGGM